MVMMYRVLISSLAPFILLFLIVKMGRFADRLGLTVPDETGARLWFHAASNGELNSARPVINALMAHRPDLRILITTNTATARDMAVNWNMARCDILLAPIDLRWAHRFLLTHWQVIGLVIVENELWPNRIATCARSGVPVAMVGARLSARSSARWAKFGTLFRTVLADVTLASAQDDASQKRLTDLGLTPEKWRTSIDLKALYQIPPVPPEYDAHKPYYDRKMTILAASTHEGEEQIMLDAFTTVQKSFSKARLILALRHPRRRDEVIAVLQKMGLPFVQHSKGQMPAEDIRVTLADTMGDMPLWYRLSGVCFVGGSLVPKGGHTPYEPIRHGCAVVHGPSRHNFAAIYERLDTVGGAILTDAENLSCDLMALLDPQVQDVLRKKAKACLPAPGDLNAMVTAIEDMTQDVRKKTRHD
ncbi:3-deoxy-D-manno-octulosonic acid transferase [Parasulfitobacter algicola]|uniref:3-deoxy-D-manno-octulosonic acid transferase n=1 Tax=Parasulfitobacter algicola TaxID=2614809 RepID=A0ABX2IQU3_9RHOB|nr:glycosyltransferase N-terminal domain-containing protein [Sulfitobacter algicola]NSX54725.1 3-deoxy-D-manno-octulosonic acid transferase [Sulfitobacter algicola]